MYFEHYSVAQISQAMNLKDATVARWINGGATTNVDNTWKYQREKREIELAETLVTDNSYHIRKLFRVSLPLLVDTVTIRAKKAATKDSKGQFPDAMSMREAKELTEIITSLDKLFRLDNNRPTDIYGIAPVTMEQLKEAISLDAFVDVLPSGEMKPIEKDEDFDEQLRKVLDGHPRALPAGRDVGPTAERKLGEFAQKRPEEPDGYDGPPTDWAGFGLSDEERAIRGERYENARRTRAASKERLTDQSLEEGGGED